MLAITPPAIVPPPLPAELLPLGGTDWNKVDPVRDTDGDTVRIRRAQITWELAEECEVGDSLIMQNWRLRFITDDPEELPNGLAARLVTLDTPELHSKDPAEREQAQLAAHQLWGWITEHAEKLRCITYDTGGGFDRILVDLYVLAEDGRTFADSASQFMLRQGWAPYVKGQ
jgi:endonuclease YncB( thermonuclease family)